MNSYDNSILVSACMITRNHARYVERCLESMLEQSTEIPIEILIGDDCSDDGTSDVVANFALAHPSLVWHIRHDPRVGGSANYLDLLSRAKGRFIAHLDGDDYWLPGKIRKQLEFLLSNPDCAAVYSNSFAVNWEGEKVGHFNDAPETRLELADLLRHGNFLNTSSMMFRAKELESILGIPGPVLDFRIHLQLARFGYLFQFSQSLTCYRVNSAGSMVATENDHVRELYWQAIQSVPRELVSDNDYAHGLADFLRRVVFHFARTRDPSILRTWAARVYAASPYGIARTTALVAVAALRTGGKILAARAPFLGNHKNVLYHY